MEHTRTVLITGGTSNLGFYCALAIARQYPEYLIVVASRSDNNSAAASINKSLAQNNVTYLPLDLASLSAVRTFVKTWETKNFPPIQALFLNAGFQFPGPLQMTGDNIESTFAINHVGHALLFHLLYPYLDSKARIVITASGTHDPTKKTHMPHAKYTTAEELAHPSPATAGNPGRQRYTSSKLANVMWSYALNRRLARLKKDITVVAFDPGLMPGTGLARDASSVERWLWLHVMPHIIPILRLALDPNVHSAKESGASLAWLVTDNEARKQSGVYFEGRKIIKSSVDSYDESKQDDLWEWTAKNVSMDDEEAKKFDMLD
ncbi:short-chain dehydrogenase [Xylogone sp. PMI_703]|nr:short-chain dehydrogenase [Xylogone sp. PMI_703]